MNKLISLEEALSHIEDGMTIMVGGFLACGTPCKIIDALAESGIKNLTLICNDTSYPDNGVGKMVMNKQFKKIIASHIGTNPETGRQLNTKEADVQLVPQGTLAERIKCGGAGLGGFLTPTGLGTIVEEGKEKIAVDGVEYLLEKPLKADVALILGSIVDEKGNVYYNKATKNFNPMMATAADTVIVQAEKLVKVGEIDPNDVMTPGLFVDYIVKEEN
jgi:acetate CoA/acetoacetate CoA-transferase alpha subunit